MPCSFRVENTGKNMFSCYRPECALQWMQSAEHMANHRKPDCLPALWCPLLLSRREQKRQINRERERERRPAATFMHKHAGHLLGNCCCCCWFCHCYCSWVRKSGTSTVCRRKRTRESKRDREKERARVVIVNILWESEWCSNLRWKVFGSQFQRLLAWELISNLAKM